MIRMTLPALLLVLGACSPPQALPTPRAAGSPDAALVEACRREAERSVLFRDRGQQMRLDEGESRVGVQASIPTLRATTDNYGQRVERDRLTEDCVRRAQSGPVPVDRRPPATRR